VLLGDDGSEDLPAEVHALRIFEECTGGRKPQHVRAVGRLMIGEGKERGVVGNGGRGMGKGEGDGRKGGRDGWGWGEGEGEGGEGGVVGNEGRVRGRE